MKKQYELIWLERSMWNGMQSVRAITRNRQTGERRCTEFVDYTKAEILRKLRRKYDTVCPAAACVLN